MFSSKSNRGKWIWAFVDLLVVVIGVYVAFLIQSTTAVQKDQREQIKVYSALKMEMETMRVGFPRFAQSNIDFLEARKDQEFFDISGWRFIEPQYGYQIIEYAINIQNNDIIDFEMYDQLQKLYVGIKQLEHMERLLTEVASEYEYLIPELDEKHPQNLRIKSSNRSRLFRFKMFLRGRAANLNRNSKQATQALISINELLGPEMAKEIERKFISETILWFDSKEEAMRLVPAEFPAFTEEEVAELYDEIRGDDK